MPYGLAAVISRDVKWIRPILAAAFAIGSTGCISIHRTRPVEIAVVDETTGTPIPDLPIVIDYLFVLVLNAPEDQAGVTGQDGKVVLPVADFKHGTIVLRAGEETFFMDADTVRHGGLLVHPNSSMPRAYPVSGNVEMPGDVLKWRPEPTGRPIAVRLTPRKRRAAFSVDGSAAPD